MAAPSGTVTFLFTDIEGSTVRWEHDPGGMADALAEHDRLLRATIDTNGGMVFATGGDGFAAAFANATSAVATAALVQEQVRLPVRIGLHTGTAVERDGNYFGRTLNRAARIMSAAHGGQIVMSDVTAGLVRDDTAHLVDLGEHRLAGVDTSIRLWQVGRREFPPLRTSTALLGNLPTPLDRFVGRVHELAGLDDLIATHRLVTVVGVGGMGKTRLVIEAGHRLHGDFDGGVWFVDLVLASSNSAVIDETASIFGVQAVPGRSVEDVLIEHLAQRTALLVFDNCEHVMRPAACLIDRLLNACPNVKIVATSREALLLRGEHVMALGPMTTDDGRGTVADAVELFVERLTAEGGPATVGDDERTVVLEICQQLDGMPLAIELAAGRARTLGASGVLTRLGERIRLLSGGWRTGVGRQQTLAATLDWSYVLLDEREQIVFDRLAVFVGWFTLDDAIAVAAYPSPDTSSKLNDDDVLDAVSALVDKSMCTVDLGSTPTRYRYLETMRAYGRDHLNTFGTLNDCRNRHAAHITAIASGIVEALLGPGELAAARHAEGLMPELRAALGWAVDQHLDDVIDDIAFLAGRQATRGSPEMAGWFYDLRHDLAEHRLVQEVAMHYAQSTKGDPIEAERVARSLIESTGDRSGGARTFLMLIEFNESHFDEAVAHLRRAHQIAMEDGGIADRAFSSTLTAAILAATGNDPGELIEQGYNLARDARWPTGLAFSAYAAGLAVLHTDPVASLEHLNRGLAAAAEVGNRSVVAMCQTLVNYLEEVRLPPAARAAALSRHLRQLQDSGDTHNALLTLSQTILLLNDLGRLRTAALICGWLHGRSGRDAQTAGEHDAAVAFLRRALGDQWDRMCQQGRELTGTQIIDLTCNELATIDDHEPGRDASVP